MEVIMLWQKKVAALFLAAIMLITLIPVQVFAADEPTLTLSTAQGSKGDTVNIGLTMTNNPGIVNLTLLVQYNATAFKLTKVEDTNLLPGKMHSDNLNDPEYCLTWANDTVTTNYTVNGLLVTLSFEILTDAPGSYPITLLSVPDGILDVDMNNINFTFVNGSVTVEAPKCDHALSFVAEAASTCAVQGTKAHYVCSKCNALFADAEGTIETTAEALQLPLDPDNHGDGLSSAGWTEKDDENHAQTCKNCQKEITEAHKWNDGEVTTPATHTEKGVKTFKCTVCEATKTEDIPTLTEHSYGDWSKLDDEYHHRTCVCGDEQKEAHKWDDGVVTVEPTEDKDGTRTLTCTVCGAKKDVVEPYHVHDYDKDFDDVKWSANASYHWKKCACGEIAYKSAHVSSDWIVDGYPNPVSIGMMHKECVICGYTLAREILPATGGVTRPAQTRQYTVTATAGDHGSISHAGKTVVKSGDNVTYVITPDEGYEIASVLVNGADIGAVREYTFWNVKSDCTISVSFREIPAAHYNPFVDVNPGDAYYDAVLYVYENGLFKGVSETEFAPDTTMTRAMFVTVLGRMAGVNPLLYQKSSFTDVEVGQWYSPYVEWAAQSGIVLGYGDGTFGLNDEITVEQAAVILARYAAFTGRSTYTLRTLHDFADSADVSDWAVYSMKWIVNTGIYTGENGMLSPKSLAKRSLVAAMLYNYAD